MVIMQNGGKLMENVTVFWGVDHKVGTTMIAQSYAEVLASKNKRSDYKKTDNKKSDSNSVLLLTLSEGLGDDFFSGTAVSVNELRSKLSCGLLTEEDIKRSGLESTTQGEPIDGIYKINGILNPKDSYAFTVEMVQDFIKMASNAFSHVVVDCGTGLHSPLTIAPLTSKSNNIFVLSQSESALRKWDELSEQMSKSGIMPQSVVVNKFIKGDKYTSSYISQRTGIPHNLFTTVGDSDFGNQAESERKTILYFGEKQFEKDILAI